MVWCGVLFRNYYQNKIKIIIQWLTKLPLFFNTSTINIKAHDIWIIHLLHNVLKWHHHSHPSSAILNCSYLELDGKVFFMRLLSRVWHNYNEMNNSQRQRALSSLGAHWQNITYIFVYAYIYIYTLFMCIPTPHPYTHAIYYFISRERCQIATNNKTLCFEQVSKWPTAVALHISMTMMMKCIVAPYSSGGHKEPSLLGSNKTEHVPLHTHTAPIVPFNKFLGESDHCLVRLIGFHAISTQQSYACEQKRAVVILGVYEFNTAI